MQPPPAPCELLKRRNRAGLILESPIILMTSRQKIKAGGWEGEKEGSKEQSVLVQSTLWSQTALDGNPSSMAQGNCHRRVAIIA